MRKRIGILALALCMALSMAHAESEPALEMAKGLLTEVYGYTREQADNDFDFQITQTDTEWQITFAPKAQPTWVYTAAFDRQSGGFLNGETPFRTGFSGYPGENGVRGLLNQAQEQNWFSQWDAAAVAAFGQALPAFGITPTQALQQGLQAGTISAGDAVREFFLSCYGSETDWPMALTQWRDATLAAYGLPQTTAADSTATAAPKQESSRVVPYMQSETITCTLTDFGATPPAELAKAFSNPHLSGWTCLSGSILSLAREDERKSQLFSRGIAVFGRGEKRLLVTLLRTANDADWNVYPVGENALPAGCDPACSTDESKLRLTLAYPTGRDASVTLQLSPWLCEGGALLELNRYRSCGPEGNLTVETATAGSDNRTQYRMTVETPGLPAKEENVLLAAPNFLDLLDANGLPGTADGWRALTREELPQGYGTCTSVHLRQKTSSRSKDLGLFQSGTPVQVLELVPGNPYSWAHVRAGGLEGYMSSVYVAYPGTDCSMNPLWDGVPLRVAINPAPVTLRSDSGPFARDGAQLPAGTRMHVIAVQGDWLYVAVPSGAIGWKMDLNSTFGFIRADAVRQGATALQAEWLL
ncbi:MAG: SH3 domain-containing protein [Candidatus Limiplasma sp.]|nr:SH3 domain-containing protein [Candidatus Limiplasma sp.]